MGGCKKDIILHDPNAKLTFSYDTVFFDTVITQLGTKTQWLTVYNPYSKSIIIHKISLANGANSEYIFNVNGIKTGNVSNVEIKPHDSLFVFIQAKLRTNGVDTAVFHKDSLLFQLDNTTQNVKIVAWGKDASFIKNQTLQTSTTWAAGKSFLIYDILTIAKGQTLTINEGVTVYFKPGANFIVDGSLVINGTVAKPVIFEGYRMESYYQQIPGQWGSILFTKNSSNNRLSNVYIVDGTSGLNIAQGNSGSVDVDLKNVVVSFMSYAGLTCKNAKITAVNCVFANCSSYNLQLLAGGDYSFIHTTVSNYNSQGINQTHSVAISNYTTNQSTKTPCVLTNAKFKNSIIVGRNSDEIEFDSISGAPYNVGFTNCLIKLEKNISYMNAASFLMNDTGRLFRVKDYNLYLDSASVAIQKGDASVGNLYPLDIKGRNRIANRNPDLGAYEYFKDTTKHK